MTRVLSELLSAAQPQFQQGLAHLERLSGHPNSDIRLSTEIQQAMRGKLMELNFDTTDTTGPELYAALGARLSGDEARLSRRLEINDDSTIADKVARSLQPAIVGRQAYALKPTRARQLLRSQQPKKTMKLLGYRSLDSMLKHEAPAAVYAAAWHIESAAWIKRLLASYANLQAADFESRPLAIEHPSSARWQALVDTLSAVTPVMAFKELGSVVLLPVAANHPPLAVLTTSVMTLHGLNDVQAAGSYLKLHQLEAGFGGRVARAVTSELMLIDDNLQQPVAWRTIHQFLARAQQVARDNIFEPMVAAAELSWLSVEDVLAGIEPALGFWQGTAHLAQAGHANRPVSCNMTDAVIAHGSLIGYERRLVHHMQQALRDELLLRYLAAGELRQNLLASLSRKLAPEAV